jgi:hypothetical protein
MPSPFLGWLLLSCMDDFPPMVGADTDRTDTDAPEPGEQLRLTLPAAADVTQTTGPGGARAVGLGDLDGDGAEEVGIAEIYATVDGNVGAGRVRILLGDPIAPYTPIVGPAWLGAYEYEWLGQDAIATGDVDGDRDPELLLGGLGFWLIDEPLQGGPIRYGSDWFGGNLAARLADIDGDGRDDLVAQRGVVNDPSEVVVWLGPPTGAQPDLVAAGSVDEGFGAALATGDLDGDGREDLAVGAPRAGDALDGAVFVYDADDLALGRYGSSIVGNDGQLAGSAVAIPGDVDGDGLSDLLVGAYAHDDNGNCGQITQRVAGALFPGPVTSGSLESGRATFTWSGPGCARLGEPLGDLDGDGLAEIAFATDETAWIFLEAPSGETTLRAAEVRVDGPVGCCFLGDADVNGDGARDLLVGQQPLGDPYAEDAEIYILLGPLLP